MSARKEWHPEKVRSELTHPVIDGDGHWIEYTPVFAEKMRKAAGDKAADGLLRSQRRIPDALSLSIAERRRRGIAMEGYWGRQSTNTRDRATAMMPRMLYDRLDELGIDFGIVYPTAGLGIPRIDDDETRRAVIRGFNIVTADYFRESQRPPDPGGGDPDAHPRGGDRGARIRHQAARLQGRHVRQRHPAAACPAPRASTPRSPALPRITTSSASTATTITTRSGRNAASSRWRRPSTPAAAAWACATPRATSPSTISAISPPPATRWPSRCSSAASRGASPMCDFGFLEGGVGWACQLFADLIEHWERRGKAGLEYMDPKKLDRPLLAQLVDKYGYEDIAAELQAPRRLAEPEGRRARRRRRRCTTTTPPARSPARRTGSTSTRSRSIFGCEPDDRMNAVAFSKLNPFGARINAIFSSDVGHFDVPDMRMVLPEAYELVEDELITADDFRDFTFANAVRLFGTQNPDFFEGTAGRRRRRRSARQRAGPRRRGITSRS